MRDAIRSVLFGLKSGLRTGGDGRFAMQKSKAADLSDGSISVLPSPIQAGVTFRIRTTRRGGPVERPCAVRAERPVGARRRLPASPAATDPELWLA